jgi:hypothetical protein
MKHCQRMPYIAKPICHLLMLFVWIIVVPGCIAIPTQMPDEEPFKDDRLSFIEIGKTTKEQLAQAMLNFPINTDEGEIRVKLYPLKFRGGDWWLYEQSREELQWIWGAASPYGPAGSGIVGDFDFQFLLIKFNENNVVQTYEVSTHEGLGCGPNEVCKGWWNHPNLACNRAGVCKGYSHLGLLASQEEDKAAKRFQPPSDRCLVYAYAELTPYMLHSYLRYSSVEVWLDGLPAGWILSKQDFLLWELDPGYHLLYLREVLPAHHPILNSDDLQRQSISLNCAAGNLYFIEATTDIASENIIDPIFGLPKYRRPIEGSPGVKPFGLDIRQHEFRNGKEDINQRQLLLSIWDEPNAVSSTIVSSDIELKIIHPGTTTRDELISKLGSPDSDYLHSKLMIYHKDGPEWLKLMGVNNGIDELGQEYTLFVSLDSERVVTEYELRRTNHTNASSITYVSYPDRSTQVNQHGHLDLDVNGMSGGRFFSADAPRAVYATSDDNKAAKKQTKAAPGLCLIYIFSNEPNLAWRIFRNDVFAAYIYDAFWPDGFLKWILPKGEYSITAESVAVSSQNDDGQLQLSNLSQSVTKTIKCRSREEIAIELDWRNDEPELVIKQFILAEQEIKKRNLILSENSPVP